MEVYKINKLVSKPHITVLTTDFVKPLILLVLSRCYKKNHQPHLLKEVPCSKHFLIIY